MAMFKHLPRPLADQFSSLCVWARVPFVCKPSVFVFIYAHTSATLPSDFYDGASRYASERRAFRLAEEYKGTEYI